MLGKQFRVFTNSPSTEEPPVEESTTKKNLIRTEELQQTNGRNHLKKHFKSPNISSGVLFY